MAESILNGRNWIVSVCNITIVYSTRPHCMTGIVDRFIILPMNYVMLLEVRLTCTFTSLLLTIWETTIICAKRLTQFCIHISQIPSCICLDRLRYFKRESLLVSTEVTAPHLYWDSAIIPFEPPRGMLHHVSVDIMSQLTSRHRRWLCKQQKWPEGWGCRTNSGYLADIPLSSKRGSQSQE